MFYNSASWPEGRKAGCLKYTHIVLCVDEKKAKRLKQKAIIIRWHKLFKGNLLTQKYLSGEQLNSSEQFTLDEMTQVFRNRLMDISWFMRVLNEDIARKANFEDNCTGRLYSLPSMALTLRAA